MTRREDDGELPRGYIIRRIYRSAMESRYNGSCATREILASGGDAQYGKSQIEAKVNKRAAKAGNHDHPRPNRGSDETWPIQLQEMVVPPKAISGAILINQADDALQYVTDLAIALAAARVAIAPAYSSKIESGLRPSPGTSIG